METLGNTSAMAALRSSVRGIVIVPGDDLYHAARSVWNGMIDKHPAAILHAAGVADVIAGVNFARELRLPLAIRGGGHNVSGNAVCEDGLVIHLGGLRQVRVDPVSGTARVGGGATWRDYDHETQAFRLASAGGAVSTTGVAGLTLGGGYGWLSRKHGMACDHLLSADLVTAEGKLISASGDSHEELFWAIRGGGGNFGVATSFQFQLHPVTEVYAGILAFPLDMARPVLRRFRELSQEAPDHITWMAGILPSPAGGMIVAVVAASFGPASEGERAVRPMRELGSVVLDTMAPRHYCELQQQLDASYPKGVRHYWKSSFLKGLSDDAIEILIEATTNGPSPLNHVVIEGYGGAVARIEKDATAFEHRDSPYNLLILASHTDATLDDAQKEWARGFHQRMAPYGTGGTYVNYQTAGEDIHEAYGGARFERLAAVKALYDPTNLFRVNQNIQPRQRTAEA
jgi:FAD/FMN-containing dehydrogenase